MSLRNFVPSYPQLPVNGPPPPHHQAHRVQALPVNMANALQQQISQQQAQQQQQSQGSAQSNQNGGNVQAPSSHEYHLAPCLPFQTPAGPNFIRHMPNGGYAQAHPQNQTIYQTQGGPPGVVQTQQSSQSNPAQSLSNQQNQARLTPMTQPTAPPTPPNQQQQQQQQPTQQAPQYAVQIQQQGLPSSAGGAGNPRNQPYRQQSVPRRQQQQMNQQLFYQQPIGPYPTFVLQHGAQVRAPTYSYMFPSAHVYNTNYQAPAPGYNQMAAPSNGQQRQSTPQATVPTMAPAQPGEYSGYPSMEVYPQVLQTPPVAQQQVPSQPPQKTAKKTGSKAIQIINPLTGKNIFEEDSPAQPSATTSSGSSIATVDKAITASHNELNKDEAVDKESSSTLPPEPSTPVVSAMSDGPSVDITPKHQVNKIKKIKPPEPVLTQPIEPTTQPIKLSKPAEVETTTEILAPVPHDIENNIVTATTSSAIVAEPVPVEPEVLKVVPAAVVDVNDTNNNNYQREVSESCEEKEIVNETTTAVAANVKEAPEVPQDTNNNSTDDKSIMTSPSIRQTVSAPAVVTSSSVSSIESEEKSVPERKISVVDGPIDYDDGQWSPANLAGKKYYTRDQLLKLKDQPIEAIQLPSTIANTLLKNNKDFLNSTLNQTMPPPGMGASGMQRGGLPFDPINSLAPKFMANQIGGRNPYQKRPSQPGNKQQMTNNGRSSQAGIIKLTLSLQDDIKLNESQNAWKPNHLVKQPELSEEDRTTHDLLSRFRSMLNKLTADNFDLLVEQVKVYKIDTSERLDGVITLLFEKAISEPKFAPTYARLCEQVATITTAPQSEADKGKKQTTLKTKLITQCQKEFERHREESIVFNEIEDKLREIENIPTSEKRDEEKSRLEEEHYKVRQRANGTVKFIGELFKINMLTSKIMRACIDMLLQDATEEKVERVCKLLTTIGWKMEKDKQDGPKVLDKYFSQLHEMLHHNHKTIRSSRIKFEIQNLQDLRNNHWKARRADLTPKTMDQIQMEADQEQQMINYQTRQNAKDDRSRGNQGNYNNRRQQQDSDGWSVQHNNKSRLTPLPFNKINLPSVNSEGPKLGQPTDYLKFMVTNTNKYSALPIDTDTDAMPRYNVGGAGSGGSKNSSMERGDRGSRYYGNGSGTSDGRYSGRSSGSNQGSRNSSQIRSRDNSDSRGGPSRSLQAPPRHQQIPQSNLSFSGAVKQPQKPPSAPTPPAGPMSDDEVQKSYKEMLEVANEYRADKLSLEKALEKLDVLSINKDVLYEIYNQFLDRKPIDRENLMLLVIGLLKSKKLSSEDNRLALIDTMGSAPDMACDVPLVYEYIAQFYAELLISSALTFQDVFHICDSYISTSGNGEKMLRYIFTAIEVRNGAAMLKQIVSGSNCDLGQFISDGNFDRWLEVNKFNNMVRYGTRGGTTDVMAHVKQLLSKQDEKSRSPDVIMDYISTTNCTIDPTFIHELTTAIVENSCEVFSGYLKLNNSRLEVLAPVLVRFIDNQRDLELKCIEALHKFARTKEFPPGLLNSTFEILYDNDVLTLEAFEMWKKKDPEEEGKGVAICSTRQFFTRLAEDKDDDDVDDYGDEGET